MKKEEPLTYIRVKVEQAEPDTTEFKPYRTTLSFPQGLYLDVPVPTVEIVEELKEGGFVLTLNGWVHFLRNYTTAIENIKNQIKKTEADSLPRYSPPTK